MPTGVYPHKRIPPEIRFFAKVRKTESCWIWTGALSQGYGSFTVSSRLGIAAYRWSYEYAKGPVPKGLQLDHLCRNRACVNPDHLEPVTQRENQMRSPIAFCSINARKTHCAKGHEYTEENTYLRPRGLGRRCRICMREQGIETRKRMKEAV